jgi:GNAT superfamily N-acetyltransferase
MDELAALRIEVFRDFPYLYDGDIGYERRYLASYLQSRQSVIIGAFDRERLVGAATASPLMDHDSAFREPFVRAGRNPAEIFYFGESVLLPRYRGQGIGVAFFHEREAVALAMGFRTCVFSAVMRPLSHPMRPDSHVGLDEFWKKRGYGKIIGLHTHFSWKDVDQDQATEKPMEFWENAL